MRQLIVKALRQGAAWSVVAVGILVMAGCGSSSGVTVTGEVTYDGTAVAAGYVTLAPADGKGETVGGEIRDGKFTIADVVPGEKIVTVSSGPQIQYPRSSGEMAVMATRGERLNESAGIPPNAVGNGQRISISAGASQALKLELKSPTQASSSSP